MTSMGAGLTRPLPTPAEMREWDRAAVEQYGIPALLLMENAGQAAVRQLGRHLCLEAKNVVVCIGKGNNGGDGAVVARLLHEHGLTVLACLVGKPGESDGPAARHLEMARAIGVRFHHCAPDGPLLPDGWPEPDIIVDAITGTGLAGDLREPALSVVEAINRMRDKAFVYALDAPSGLCAMRGKPRPIAVRAHATACFEAGKPGLSVPEAFPYTGTLTIHPVGIPRAVKRDMPASWECLAPKKGSWPTPSPYRHKGDGGNVLVVGGSEGMQGAPMLAAYGALRAGAGLVHLARPGAAADGDPFPELQTHGLGSKPVWDHDALAPLLKLMRSTRPDALVVGPGMGRNQAAHTIVQAILKQKDRPPIILDADALYCFRSVPEGPEEHQGQRPLSLAMLEERDIVTPHPAEMARLLPDQTQDPLPIRTARVQEDRPAAVSFFTGQCQAVLVLKGAGTLIAQSGHPTAICPIAAPALAVGGSGDVLSGICAAIAASGQAPHLAAKLAVYLHARSGELLAARAPLGHLAREIADCVPLVWEELCTP